MSAYIVWHNDNSNETQIWVMNGDNIMRRVTVQDEHGQPIFVGPPWRIVAAKKFEIIWHNDNTNETQIWFMTGNEAITSPDRIARRATVIDGAGNALLVGPPFVTVGAGELGLPLGPTCIIWHNNATNETKFWVMNDGNLVNNGEKVASTSTVRDENGQQILVGLPWRIIGAWQNQIAWHNDATNETQIWEMRIDQIGRRITVQNENGQPIFVGLPCRPSE